MRFVVRQVLTAVDFLTSKPSFLIIGVDEYCVLRSSDDDILSSKSEIFPKT
jgi:hypothetical protein